MKDIEDYVDDLVDTWHTSDKSEDSLAEFLGMTAEQYKLWVEKPSLFYQSGLGQAYIEDILGKEYK